MEIKENSFKEKEQQFEDKQKELEASFKFREDESMSKSMKLNTLLYDAEKKVEDQENKH